jgi:hypothetical protein
MSVVRGSMLRFGLVLLVALCGTLDARTSAAAETIRIGIVRPKAQLGQGASGADVAEPVRQSLLAYLGGPMTELVPLQSLIPLQASVEAEQAGCQYVLYTSIVHKKGGGFGRMLGAMAPIVGTLPGMAVSGSGSMVASQAATMAMSAAAQMQAREQAGAALSSASQGQIGKGDVITLEYSLQKLGQAKPVLANSGKRKASQDGEDLISPLVEAAATEVLSAASR